MISYPTYPYLPPVISTMDVSLGIGAILNTIGSSVVSGAWPTASRAILTPIILPDDATVVKLWLMTGGTANGNVDIGIYDEALALKVSSGAVAQGTANLVQVFDITDTVLRRGRYFIGVSLSSGTGTTIAYQAGLGHLRASGMVQMAAAHALPATITPAALTSSYVPVAGLSLRTTV